MIQLTEIQKSFGKLQVLKNIDLEFNQRQIVALLGPNASGKTTLIKIILGMVLPDSGIVEVHGKPITEDWTYRSDLGYMPQIGRFPENMKVGQVLDMINDLRGKMVVELDDELYEAFRLKDILHKKISSLSGGTRQKVSAHLAFCFNPNILILDEPTAGLDPLSSLILKNKILDAKNEGKLVIITSHILSELDDIVERVIYLEEGSICFDKNFVQLQVETGKNRLTEIIAHYMKTELV